jgi:nitroreductase
MDIFDAMETCRAIRYFKKDPVSDDIIDKLIYAATRAPSAGNVQAWDFVVVTDPVLRKKIGDGTAAIIPAAADEEKDGYFGGDQKLSRTQRLMLRGARLLGRTMADVPLHIAVCSKVEFPRADPDPKLYVWSTLYPAAQNILLAARALGLGACLTTNQSTCGPVIRETLGIPDDVIIACYLALGWPAVKFGPVVRRPIEQHMHRNAWRGDLRKAV